MKFLTFIFILLLLASCQRSENTSSSLPPLVRTFVTSASPGPGLELRGTITYNHRTRLGFKQGGVIAEIKVDAGDRVKEGQVVASLDKVDFNASLNSARAGYDKAKSDLERAEKLLSIKAVSVNTRDDVRTAFLASEAALTIAKEALERTQLYAPADGIVFARLAEPGETVGPGTPILVIDEVDHIVIRSGVTEDELIRIKEGRPTAIELSDKKIINGQITSLAATPNTEDGLYTIEVTPDSSEKSSLVPGALVRIRFENSEAQSDIRIPLDALVHRNDNDFVFVINSTREGSTVKMRPITIGHISGKEVIVNAGLTGMEKIVAEGAYFLNDNQTVRIEATK
jgi:RND family efflux transporter MFP subunit